MQKLGNKSITTGGRILVGLAVIGSSVLLGPAAQAVEQPPAASAPSIHDEGAASCKQYIAKLRSSSDAKAAGIGPEQAVDYYCGGGQASVSPKGDQSRAVTSESVSDKSLKSDSMSTDVWLGEYWVNHLPGEDPIQEIKDPYTSSVAGTFYYGQDYPGTTVGDWTRAVDMMITVNLKSTRHDFNFGWSADLGPWEEALSVDGFIKLQKNEGWEQPEVVDHVFFSTPAPKTSDSWTGELLQPQENGVYSFQVGDLRVTNPAKAFTIRISGSMSVPRFLCNFPGQCNYPDGEEAPVFG